MCLTPIEKERVAINNIIVYKKLFKDGDKLLSPIFKDTEWKIGELKTSRLTGNPWRVFEGLHSYTTKKRVDCTNDEIIVKCIIPKGATYIRGLFNEIVSTQLIPIEICV